MKKYTIKPIEWEICEDGSFFRSIFGLIQITYQEDINEWSFDLVNRNIWESQYKSEAEARQAAKEWYIKTLQKSLIELG